MINLLGTVDDEIAVAVSGGSDSMAALHFLRNGGKRKILALHFNHGTDHAADAEALVTSYCYNNNIPLVIGELKKEMPKGASKENFWRENRYSFFTREAGNRPVITCHHLDDVVETWLFTSFHGNPMLIPHSRDNFVRPFLATRKSDLTDWCNKKGVPFVFDDSNNDIKYMRNFIRNKIINDVLIINPGIHKTLKKKVIRSYKDKLLMEKKYVSF